MYFSPGEFADVRTVADRLGMRPGAWVGEMAVRYARGLVDPVPADWREVVLAQQQHHVQVAQVGRLLNQVARHANATGEFEVQTERVLEVCERMLLRVDEATAEASRRAGLAR